MRLPPVEVGALLLLLVALAITASFFFDPAQSSSGEPRGVSLGLRPDAGDADAPVASPAAGPPQHLPRSVPVPERWLITYFVEGVTEGVVAHQGTVEALDLEFAGAPFGDLTDDSWWLSAETGFELAAGRYVFVLEHDGLLEVYVDDRLVASQADSAGPVGLEVGFAHAGGFVSLRIAARDGGGPFLLRWAQD